MKKIDIKSLVVGILATVLVMVTIGSVAVGCASNNWREAGGHWVNCGCEKCKIWNKKLIESGYNPDFAK